MAAPLGNDYAKANSKYDESYPELARKLCLLGHTDEELGQFFGVSETTINNWKLEHPKFLESIREGKLVADMNVVEALYKGTQDRVVVEQQAFKVRVGQYEETVEVVEVEKVIPADFRNQQFWLKNRQSRRWADKQEIDHTSGGEKIQPTAIVFSKGMNDKDQ